MKTLVKLAVLAALVNSSAMAWWLDVKSIDAAGVVGNGKVIIKATKLNNAQVTYLVDSATTHAKEILATALTVKSATGAAQLSINGIYVDGIVAQ